MWVRVSTALDGSAFSLLLVFLDSLLSQRMKVMGGNMIFPRERQTPDWQPVPEQLIAASSTSSQTVQLKPALEFAVGARFARIRYPCRTAFVNFAYAEFHSYSSFHCPFYNHEFFLRLRW